MTHHNDNELPGLPQALARLPAFLHYAALIEFQRGLGDEGFAEFIGPEAIWYHARADGPLKRALLLKMRCPNFTFELFFVPVRKIGRFPVVGRAYFTSAFDFVSTVN